MNYTVTDLITTLFNIDDRVQIRVIDDGGKGATNAIHVAVSVSLCQSYPTAFPCIGVNPRATARKLSTIKNLVIDIDEGDLPEWATERADLICSRDKQHHHLYFCFTETTREVYKEHAAKLIALIPNADRAVSDPERVIRLPGFAHRKNGVEGDGYKIVFKRDTVARVPIEEKFSWLQRTPKAEVLPLAKSSTIDYLRTLYGRKPIVCEGEGRGRDILLLGFDCHFWGIAKESAYALAVEIANARHSPPESDDAIRKLIDNAYKYARGEFGAALSGDTPAAQNKIRKAFEQINRVREKMANWIYVHEACRFVDTQTGRVLTTREQIEDYISQTVGEPVSLRKLLSGRALETCEKIEYDPATHARTFEKNGVSYYNSYRENAEEMPRAIHLKDSAAKTFLEHINFIGTSPEERVTLLQYFAFCVQNIGQKVDWTPLIISPREGLGKSAFNVLFRKIFGEHNCSTVSAHKLLSGWTDFIAEKLFVTSHEVETNEAAALTELKTLITETRVSVNAKYARTYETNNCANFLLLSNKTTALRLEENARRFFVVLNKSDPKEKDYYNNLFDAIENGAGWIYDELMQTDISTFDAHGNAPKTVGLAMLTEATKTDATAWLDEQIEHKLGVFANPIVDIPSIEREAQTMASSNVHKFMSRRTLTEYLHKVGFAPREYWINGAHKRGWFKGTDEEFADAVLVLRGEKATPDKIPF